MIDYKNFKAPRTSKRQHFYMALVVLLMIVGSSNLIEIIL
jgi:hypothetical protein